MCYFLYGTTGTVKVTGDVSAVNGATSAALDE